MPTQTRASSQPILSAYRPLTDAIITVAAVGGFLALLIVATGHDPVPALAALWRGSFGSPYAFASATLVRSIPLVLAGLAVALAFRAGIWNIGAEGQLLAGAAAATSIGLAWSDSLGPWTPVFALTGGALAGAFVAAVAGLLRVRFGVLEIISTIMLNFTALHVVGYLVRGPLQEPTGIYPQSATLSPDATLPIIVPGTRLHVGLVLAIGAGVALWLLYRHTALGFRIRALGANPEAAQIAGSINVARISLGVFLASGALAGLAGSSEVTGVTYALYENLSPGYGYSAIAVALLARLHPLGVIATGVFLGGLHAGGAAMQRDAHVPSVLVSVVEAVLVLSFAIAARPGRRRLVRPDTADPSLAVDGIPR